MMLETSGTGKIGRVRLLRDSRLITCSLLLFAFLACLALNSFAQDLELYSNQLNSGDVEQKRDALLRLRNLRSEAASRIALPALNDRNEMVRATAASSVLWLPPVEAARALLPLLSDKAEFVRREAAYALGETHDPSAATALIKSLESDKSLEVRSAAAVALGKIGNADAVPALISVLKARPTEDNEFLRRAATRSIGEIAQILRTRNPKVITPQNFLPDKYKDIAAPPVSGSSPLPQFAGVVPVLKQVLESNEEADDTRREAAFALGAIGDRSAESVLQKYVGSSDVYLAEICKEALLKLKAVE